MDHPQSAPIQSAEPAAKPKKISKSKRWKEIKKARRAERKAYYSEAPALVKAWHLWLKKTLAIILVVAIIGGICGIGGSVFLTSDLFLSQLINFIDNNKRNPVDQAKIYELSPIDEEGAARIDAVAPIGENETWGIYVYMVGSNLEDQNQNDLSDLTRLRTSSLKEENRANKRGQMIGNLETFAAELESKGLDMPEYLYMPNIPVQASSTAVTEDVVVALQKGAASADIEEMLSGVWRDNISIVIQTGGATHWTNSMMNPNKTQRFLYQSGRFSEVANLPLQDSCAPETLSDFLRFCNEDYPADHKIVILWDHGSGVEGYGYDSIFGSSLTLKDLQEAFGAVYTSDSDQPPIDILGFDACLMASAEVADSLDGFAEYLVASEDVEPGDGWDYGVWLQAMTDNPTMSAAQVGRAMADSFLDYYMTYNENIGWALGKNEVTMSVLDLHKAAETYRAYRDLCAVQLKDAAEDLGVLAEIGRIAGKATRYGSYVYDQVNAVDLGEYMDLLADTYPQESQKVRTLLKEAVLYHRESGSLSGSQGLSVYVPVETKGIYGLLGGLGFVYDISEYEDVAALYYYKMAGCLNADMSRYLAELTGTEPKVLNVEAFRNFARITPVVEKDYWYVPVNEELQEMMQSYILELASYDEAQNCITYYGHDEYVVADGDGNLVSEFEGKWVALDGVLLSADVVSTTESSVAYRSKVKCGSDYYYLMFSYDRDTELFSIGGLKKIQTGDETIQMLNTKQPDTEMVNKKIRPVYSVHSFIDGSDSEILGDTIKIKRSSEITLEDLPAGRYLSSIVISDPRGDSYYSCVVEQQVKGGKITAQEVSTEFYGRAD